MISLTEHALLTDRSGSHFHTEMTWILGAGIPFGYGALVSDVRVTWRNGTTRDVLQKIYPVGSMLMAGFAGSVEMGFCLVGDMARSMRLPEGRMWDPKGAARH